MSKKLLKEVIEYMNAEASKIAPEVKAEELCENGAVYYMNGNDGTQFDWSWNDNLCEFYKFYKSTEYGFIKVYVNKNGYLSGYLYKNEGRADAIVLERKYWGENKARQLRYFIQKKTDDIGRYDKPICDSDYNIII